MAINNSEHAVHLTNKLGEPVCVLPGEDIPDWATVTNPYVSGEVAQAPPDGPPPRAGKGSSEDNWRAYAAENGVVVEGIAGRDEIVAACEAAGVAVG